MRRKTIFLLLAAYILFGRSAAQDLAPRDKNEINSRAIALVKEFEQLLNAITLKSTTPSEVQELVQICYSDPDNRIFYNEKSVLEDDIIPGAADSAFVKDVSIQKYLNDLNLFYTKQYDETIQFSDFRLSPIKSKAYTYVKVYYLSKFGGRHKEIDVPYPPARRVAEVRAEKAKDGKWKLYISSITFFKYPKGTTESEINALVEKEYQPFVPIKTITLRPKDDKDTTSAFNLELQRKADSLYAAAIKEQTGKLEEQRRKDELFGRLVKKADSLYNERKLAEALETYTEARAVKPYETSVRSRINEITRLLAAGIKDEKELLENYIKEGDRLYQMRVYDGAKANYKQALALQPDNQTAKAKLEQVDAIIRTMAELKGLYTAGDFKNALKGYNKLINDNKNNPDYYYERAQCYNKMKDYKKALADLNKAIELAPDFSDAIVSRASIHLRLNDVPKAISDYTTLLATNPADVQNLVRRGNAYLNINDFAAAEKDFSAALNIEKDNPLIMRNLANTYFMRQQYHEAITWLDKAIQINPGYSDAWFLRGFARFKLGDYAAANQDILKCRSLGMSLSQRHQIQTAAEAFLQKAQKAIEAKNQSEALTNIDIALSVLLDNEKAWAMKGDAWMLTNDYNQAKQAYEKAITINPSNAAIIEKLANVNFNSGRYEAAIPYFKKSIKQDPEYQSAYLNLAKAYIELTYYDSAITVLSKLIEIDKNNKDVYLLRAKAHNLRENYSRALVDLDLVLNQDKKNANAYYQRAQVYRNLKQPDKAVSDFEKAEELGYDAFLINQGLAQAYHELGDDKKAIKYYTNAIKMNSNVAILFYERGLAHLALKKEREAMNDLSEAFKMDTTLAKPQTMMTLAFLKLKFAEYPSAEELFKKILADDKYNAKARYGLACANFYNGKQEQAFKSFEEAFSTKKIRWSDIEDDPWLKEISKTKEFKKIKKAYL